ncbi:hypothetical protein HK103_002244 [Boothiomyces macroporosus]|uniref:GH16 domain-containing protein n=1 Tax=Boothiomyces macroporosus TaxID=261099 RepID=A0AAD5Y2L8_9FUNG|nr:hypothetical protein HK103_002244 [Boothiomyces macroporosus]
MIASVLFASLLAQSPDPATSPEYIGNCLSQTIDFSDTSRIFDMGGLPTLTDIKGLDVSRYDMTMDYNSQNIKIIPGSGVRLDLTPNKAGGDPVGTRMSSTRFMQYGKVSAVLKAPAVSGIVITFISMGPQLPDPNVDLSYVDPSGGDEIDWELLGSDPLHAESNIFYRGIPEYGIRSGTHPLSNNITEFHKYTIDWKHDLINFLIDDQLVRTYYKNSTLATDSRSATEQFFPNRAGKFQISIWSQASNTWAGGAAKFANGVDSYSAYYKSIEVECYDSNDTVVPKWPNSASNPDKLPSIPNQPTAVFNGVIPKTAAPGFVGPITSQYDGYGNLITIAQTSFSNVSSYGAASLLTFALILLLSL